MAYTAEMRRATQAHQVAQRQIDARAIREMLTIWPAWNLEALDETWEPVMAGLLGIGEHYYRLSSLLGAEYYSRLRALAGVEGEYTPARPEFDRDKAINNLMLLGPIFTKKGIANNQPRPLEVALVRVQGALSTMVLDGGRHTIQLTSDSDPRALGTRRITAGTCKWCLQLKAWGHDGRGPMVEGRSWRGHNNCRCGPEPAWEDTPPDAMLEEEGGPFKADQPFQPLGKEGTDLRGAYIEQQPTLGMSVKERFESVVKQLLGVPDRGMEVTDYGVATAAKMRVQERIGTRLDGRFLGAAERKLEHAADELRGLTYDYGAKEAGASYGQRVTATLVGEWAGTSGDASPVALSLQKAAAKRFGLDFDPQVWRRGNLGQETINRMEDLYGRHEEVFTAFVEEMYKETQDLLDAMYPGATHVPLGRGVMIMDESAVTGIRYKEMTPTDVLMNPMSSMSVHEPTATDFGNLQIRALVPKERIIGTPLSGYGCLNEYEFVVLGHKTPDPVMAYRSGS